ncbi:capsular polysaccharide biosynthesis protein, partial [Pseudomonas sp. MWU12-2323]|nr:capsular polysaccharide biosynthesis protein [Pseudomonas sp. MWU12-2323]
RISKYNVGGAFRLPETAVSKRVLLVPGQVEDDASIRTGSPQIHSNLALLQAARLANPQAWIVYKPHPDVIAGNRKGAVPADALAALADQVAIDADIADCLRVSDEVHTMTSLAGFEALLQGKTVHCYGAPFYAG